MHVSNANSENIRENDKHNTVKVFVLNRFKCYRQITKWLTRRVWLNYVNER